MGSEGEAQKDHWNRKDAVLEARFEAVQERVQVRSFLPRVTLNEALISASS